MEQSGYTFFDKNTGYIKEWVLLTIWCSESGYHIGVAKVGTGSGKNDVDK